MQKNNRKKIWIISGEESGDIYGAALIKELRALEPAADLDISVMGGRRMAATGADLMVDATELGVVGILEVMSMIFTFIKIFKNLVNRAKKERPDCVVLIDYPGFNLRFAKQMHKIGVKVVWYISPQVWAWKKGRIAKLAKYCDKMLVIFPFEVDVYKESKLPTEFVGHPLVEVVQSRKDSSLKRDDNLLLLLPGSRSNEINRLFVPMLETACELHKRQPDLRFLVSAPRETVYKKLMVIYNEFCESRKLDSCPEIEISYGDTGKAMQIAGTGLAASGTVTVECAIAGLPLTVAYKLNPITFFIAKMIVTLDYFTMVNIIADKAVFDEFLQEDVNASTLADSVEKILPGGSRRLEVETGIREVVDALSGNLGKDENLNASKRAAIAVYKMVQ